MLTLLLLRCAFFLPELTFALSDDLYDVHLHSAKLVWKALAIVCICAPRSATQWALSLVKCVSHPSVVGCEGMEDLPLPCGLDYQSSCWCFLRPKTTISRLLLWRVCEAVSCRLACSCNNLPSVCVFFMSFFLWSLARVSSFSFFLSFECIYFYYTSHQYWHSIARFFLLCLFLCLRRDRHSEFKFILPLVAVFIIIFFLVSLRLTHTHFLQHNSSKGYDLFEWSSQWEKGKDKTPCL